MKKLKLAIGLILISLFSCSEQEDTQYLNSICDQITTVDNSRYKNASSEGFVIRNVQLSGDCLEVVIASSGCSGNTWKVELIDAGRVAESNPEQRDLKIVLDNREMCTAMVNKTYTFDLRPVRTQRNVVLLNLEHWDELIPYEY